MVLAGLGLTSLFAASGCRDTELLYWTQPNLGQSYSYSHKIRDIAGNPKLDVLWVIDNSGSMASHQQRVIDNTQAFMQNFIQEKYLDWRMAVLSSDTSNDPYLGILPQPVFDSKSPAPVATFQRAVGDLGTSGSAVEKFFEPVIEKLKSNPGFLRSDAILGVIFVTDAPEQSPMSAASFLSQLEAMKGGRSKIAGFGVLGPGDWGCPSTDDDWDYSGSKYESFLELVQGKTYKLCEDFGPSLAELGKLLVQMTVAPKIFLETRPRAGTLRVVYKGQALPPGSKDDGGFWVYDPQINAVVFHDLDFAGADPTVEEVQVSYRQDTGQDLPEPGTPKI
jgi:hypothetical protein